VEYAIASIPEYLFAFGNGDIAIFDECNMNKTNHSYFGWTYKPPDNIEFGSDEANSYLAGAFNFKVEEIEVFLIID
jgi:hypothetical protein